MTALDDERRLSAIGAAGLRDGGRRTALHRLARAARTHPLIPAVLPVAESAALAQARSQAARYEAVLGASVDAVLTTDQQGRITGWSASAQELFGWSAQEALGCVAVELLPAPADREAFMAAREEFLATGRSTLTGRRFEARGVDRHGVEIPVECSVVQTELLGQPLIGITIRDLRETQRRDVALREIRQRMDAVLSSAPMVLFALDRTGCISFIEGGGLEQLGRSAAGILGRTPDEVFHRDPQSPAVVQRALSGETFTAVLCHGDLRYETWFQPVGDGAEVDAVVGVAVDVSERERMQARMDHLQMHDGLTGLPNRSSFLRHVAAAVEEPATGSSAVMVIDVDGFTLVNDTLGHAGGDVLLQRIAERFAGALQPGEVLARSSGDEFLLLASLLSGAPGAAESVGRRMLDALDEPFVMAGAELAVTASVGITVAPAHGRDAVALLEHADRSLQRAKRFGYRTVAVYERSDDLHRPTLELAARLRRALELDQLVLHYQPVVDLRSGATIGVEALLRWQLPDGSLVPPSDFIPLAEDTGLIEEMGGWVIEEACRQLRRWRDRGLDIRVSVNVAPRQLRRSDFVGRVEAALRHNGIPRWRLAMEVTETAAMLGGQLALSSMMRLREAGVVLAVDDFGAGYSSLARLRELPADIVKIDRALLDGLPRDPAAVALVAAVATLARALDLDVVAEGVETERQRDALLELGVGYAQGFLFARPLPAERATEHLLDARSARADVMRLRREQVQPPVNRSAKPPAYSTRMDSPSKPMPRS